MRISTRAGAVALLMLSLGGLGAPGVAPEDAAAADKLRVVATTTDLKALAEAVGGDLVEVDSLARGNQNPHDLEVRPSLMVKVRRADLLVINGLDLDQWAEVVVQGANNPNVLPGAPGRVDASRGPADAGGADHPGGPLDGRRAPGRQPALHARSRHGAQITANILSGLARLRPQSRPAFEKNRAAFLTRLDAGDDALGGRAGALQGREGRAVPSRLRLPLRPLRPGQGRRDRGSARDPRHARPPGPPHPGR